MIPRPPPPPPSRPEIANRRGSAYRHRVPSSNKPASAVEYGRALPTFCANLLVRDPQASADWYQAVLAAVVVHADADFAALELLGVPLMLHADHTYSAHPWYRELKDGAHRGVGAELRLLGMSPDVVAAAVKARGGRVQSPPMVKPHGWRETVVVDPDGYTWAVGERT